MLEDPSKFSDLELLAPDRITHLFGSEIAAVATKIINAELRQGTDVFVIHAREERLTSPSEVAGGSFSSECIGAAQLQALALLAALNRGCKLIVLEDSPAYESDLDRWASESAVWAHCVASLTQLLEGHKARFLVLSPPERIRAGWKFFCSRRLEAFRSEGLLQVRFAKERQTRAQRRVYTQVEGQGWVY